MLCILGLGVDHDDGTFFGTMECQWFFTCQPLVSMVFSMVSYSGNIGLNGLEKASDGHQWFTEKRLFIVNMAPVSEI